MIMTLSASSCARSRAWVCVATCCSHYRPPAARRTLWQHCARRARGLVTVGFTGLKGLSMGADCDHLLIAPAEDTPIIQQIHLAVAHGICDVVEQTLMGNPPPA